MRYLGHFGRRNNRSYGAHRERHNEKAIANPALLRIAAIALPRGFLRSIVTPTTAIRMTAVSAAARLEGGIVVSSATRSKVYSRFLNQFA